MDELKEAGKRLKIWRKKEELTQTELAEKLNFTQHFISRVEGGTLGFSQKNLQRIPASIDINLHWLLTGIGK